MKTRTHYSQRERYFFEGSHLQRTDRAFLYEFGEGFVDDFAIESGEFRDLACVERFASFAHGFENGFLFAHIRISYRTAQLAPTET